MVRRILIAAAVLTAPFVSVHGLAADNLPISSGFSSSLRFPVDRDATQQIETAANELAAGDFTAGLSRLQRFLSREPAPFVFRNGSIVNVYEVCNQLIQYQSADVQNVYERLFGQRAATELSAALETLNWNRVRNLTDRFRHTNSGRQAAMLLAAFAFDSGDSIEAAEWISFIDRNTPTSKQPDDFAVFKDRLVPPAGDSSQIGMSPHLMSEDHIEWQLDLGIALDAQQIITDALSRFRAQALHPQLNARPLIVSDLAVTRTLLGLTSFNVQTGDEHWEYPINDQIARFALNPSRIDNSSHAERMTSLVLRRLVRSSLTDRLAADADRVYALEVPDDLFTGNDKPTDCMNRLLAVDAQTGELAWSFPKADESNSRRSRRRADRWFLLGPPLIEQDRLLILAERSGSLELAAIQAEEGTLLWSIPLSETVRPLSMDRERLHTACVLSKQGELVVCPTAAGAVICVDVLKRRVAWVHRLPRIDLPDAPANPNEQKYLEPFDSTPTRNAWPAAVAWHLGPVAVVVSPESDQVMGLDSVTGRRIWSRQRGDGINVYPTTDGRLLIVGEAGLHVVDAEDGHEEWLGTTDRISETGLMIDGEFHLPVSQNGVVNLSTPIHDSKSDSTHELTELARNIRVTSDPFWNPKSPPAQTLTSAQGLLLAQSPTEIQRIDPHDTQTPAQAPTVSPLAETIILILQLQSTMQEQASFLINTDGRLRIADTFLTWMIDASKLREAAAESVFLSLHAETSASELDESSLVNRVIKRLEPLGTSRLFLTNVRKKWSCRLDRWIMGEQAIEPLQTDSSLPTQLARPQSPWPADRPTMQDTPTTTGPSHFIPVPTTVAYGSPWNNVTIEVDRQGRHVQFHQASSSQPVVVRLPRATSNARHNVSYLHGWSSGDVFILRIGTELIAYRHDADGHLPTSALWPADGTTLSLLGPTPSPTAAFRELPQENIPDWSESSSGFIDTFGRAVANVGPVTDSYLCYQVRGDVIALDPKSGEELWRRAQNPIGTYCFGDGQHVVLFHPRNPTVSVLSAIDGRDISKWDYSKHHKSQAGPLIPISIRQSTAVFRQAGERSFTLVGMDLVRGVVLWSRELDAGTVPFSIGSEDLGTVEPSDEAGKATINFLSWETGQPLQRFLVTSPTEIENIHTFTDGVQSYVILSEKLNRTLPLPIIQIHGGYGRPVVNGWLHAFDRQTSEHVWEARLGNRAFPLHQPRHVPLIVVNDLIRTSGRHGNAGRLLCLDQRTGETLAEVNHSTHIYYAIDTDLSERRIDLRMKGRRLRFSFGDDDTTDISGLK